MFLTDGTPTSGIIIEEELKHFIDNLYFIKKAIIFAYSLGPNSLSNIPQSIACMRNGIFEWIQDVNELYLKLNSYFVILSLGMDISKPLWVEPYIDASGLGEMTTCSIPVYDRSVTPFIFLGVIGIDVLVDEFYKTESSREVIQNILISKSMSACVNSNISECQINTIREDKFKCSTSNQSCNKIKIIWDICPNTLNNIFCNKDQGNGVPANKDPCCGTDPQACTKQNVNGSMIKVSLLFVVVVLIILIYM